VGQIIPKRGTHKPERKSGNISKADRATAQETVEQANEAARKILKPIFDSALSHVVDEQ
jgi:hypothetical protein